jgi:hypothetical protein
MNVTITTYGRTGSRTLTTYPEPTLIASADILPGRQLREIPPPPVSGPPPSTNNSSQAVGGNGDKRRAGN